jgi:hypothetical protein
MKGHGRPHLAAVAQRRFGRPSVAGVDRVPEIERVDDGKAAQRAGRMGGGGGGGRTQV